MQQQQQEELGGRSAQGRAGRRCACWVLLELPVLQLCRAAGCQHHADLALNQQSFVSASLPIFLFPAASLCFRMAAWHKEGKKRRVNMSILSKKIKEKRPFWKYFPLMGVCRGFWAISLRDIHL